MKTSYLLGCLLVVGCAALPIPPPVPLPASTPEQLGRLVVLESMQSSATGWSNLVLSYTNDTELPLRDVRLACTLLDNQDRVVNSDTVEIDRAPKGEEITKKLRIHDAHASAARVECEVAAAKPDAVRADAN